MVLERGGGVELKRTNPGEKSMLYAIKNYFIRVGSGKTSRRVTLRRIPCGKRELTFEPKWRNILLTGVKVRFDRGGATKRIMRNFPGCL